MIDLCLWIQSAVSTHSVYIPHTFHIPHPDRESSKADKFSLFANLQSKFKISQALLLDLMPSHAVAQMMREHQGGTDEETSGDCQTATPQRNAMEATSPLKVAIAAAFGRNSLGSSTLVADESIQSNSDLCHPHQCIHTAKSSPPPQRSRSHRLSGSLSLSDGLQLHGWLEEGDAGGLVLEGLSMSRTFLNSRGSFSPVTVAKGEHHRTTAARVADSHECVTIFFSDLIGFSSWASNLPPVTVMATLNDLYSRLDDIITNELPTLYKVRHVRMFV